MIAARPLFDTRRLPLAFDAEAGREAARDLGHAEGAALIAGAAGTAPYLARLIRSEAAWLRDALDVPAEQSVARLLEQTRQEAPDLGAHLRRLKRRVALLTALADLGGTWTLSQVTDALTNFADAALEMALRAALLEEIKRASLPGQSAEDVAQGCGMVAIAMGKMGAHELNYSSDIDLICLFDETRFEPSDFGQVRSSFVRATRATMKTLSQITDEGYVFRTDLRLRPDPSVTPICLSMEAAERYYESLGRTWERAAHIKARPAAGDLTAGAAYLARLRPFVYRRHLDFAAIQDAHNIRLKIRDHRGLGGAIKAAGHDLKLGRGGIREIEFFSQTRQLIAGGRDGLLRPRGTLAALSALAQSGWVAPEVAAQLSDNYVFLRDLEHRVQMMQDAQTHLLPGDAAGLERIACLSGVHALADFVAEIETRLAQTEALIDPLYAGAEVTRLQEDLPFSPATLAVTQRWKTYPALRSERARDLFHALRPQVLNALAQAGNPDEALINFDSFISGLPAGVQLFSLFQAQPKLVSLIVDICAVAPDLAQYLGRNSGVLDAVLDGDFFQDLPTTQTLIAELRAEIAGGADFEVILDRARRWHKEHHFRIGVHLLRGLIPSAQAGAAYANLAEAVLICLWPEVCHNFSMRYGDIPGGSAAVLGMGSLGAGTLHARSDLDLIVIYEAPAEAISSGARGLPARSYYAKLTQSLITALSAMTAQGRLYEVDMRLRPSGRKGPVATSITAFARYQREEARIWEHLALTRARILIGSSKLTDEITQVRHEILGMGAGLAPDIAEAVQQMRQRFVEAGRLGAGLELKHGAGRMQEIELAAQAQALAMGAEARETIAQLRAGAALFDPRAAKTLAQIYAEYARLIQPLRLLAAQTPSLDSLGPEAVRLLLAGAKSQNLVDLETHLSQIAAEAAEVIDRALGPVAQKREPTQGGAHDQRR